LPFLAAFSSPSFGGTFLVCGFCRVFAVAAGKDLSAFRSFIAFSHLFFEFS
jgi:hypothetical protein